MRRARVALTLLICFVGSPWSAAEDELPPIRRVLIDPARPPAELTQARDMIRVEKDRFERALQQARALQTARRNPPRLLEARYNGELRDNRLVGAAEWTLHNPHPFPCCFRLEPWNLALRGEPLLDSLPAILGELGAMGPGVVLETEGPHRLTFGWSARLEQRPEGQWFYFRVPPAPTSVLELTLPKDLQPESPAARQVVITAEPGAAENRWRITFGGLRSSELELLFRRVQDPGKPTLVFSRTSTTYVLDPRSLDARFDFDVEIHHGRLQQLTFEVDADLQPSEVILKSGPPAPLPWRLHNDAGRKQLVVMFPDALTGRGAVEVRCAVEHADSPIAGRRLHLPGVRLKNAILLGESIQIRWRQPLALTDWDFADFTPADAPAVEREGTELGEILSLVQRGLMRQASPARPSARVTIGGADVVVRQDAWWTLGASGSSLVVRSHWQVNSGRLLQLAHLLPPGWQVGDVELSPTELLLDWYADKSPAGETLVAELRESPGVRAPVTTVLRLRPIQAPMLAGGRVELPLPRVAPLAVRHVEGSLAVVLEPPPPHSPQLTAYFTDLTALQKPPPAPRHDLWAAWLPVPDLFCKYHGNELRGKLIVEPVQPRARPPENPTGVTGPAKSRQAPSVRFDPIVEDAALDIYAQPGAALRCRYWCRIRAPATAEVRLRLPADFNLLQVRRDGAVLEAITSDGRSLAFPMSAGTHECEVEYTHRESLFPVAALVTASAPGWGPPVVSLAPRTRFFVAAGHVPVGIAHLREASPQPALGETRTPAALAQSLATLASHRPSRLKAIEKAWEQCSRGEATQAIADVLAEIERNWPDDSLVFVVDQRAPGPAGAQMSLTSEAPRTLAEWRSRSGAAFLESTTSVLITTEAQCASWDVRPDGIAPTWLAAVVEEAVAHGRDPTGRFVILNRLHHPATTSAIEPTRSLRRGEPAAGWRVWEVESSAERPTILCLHLLALHAFGLVLAGIVLAVGLWRPARRFEIASVTLFAGLLLAFWLPDTIRWVVCWPIIAGALLGLMRAVRRPLSMEGSTLIRARPALVASVLLAAYLWPPARAQKNDAPPTAATVYLIPGQRNEELAVLAPASLWRQITTQSQRTGVDIPDHVLISAEYSARETGGVASIAGSFQVHLLRDGPLDVPIPLGGARLQRALLDMAPTLAAPLQNGEGFAIRIQGKGRHLVRLEWESPTSVRGEERELACRWPALVSSRLEFHSPSTAERVRLQGARGADAFERRDSERWLVADLGRSDEITVRWRDGSSASPQIQVREVCVLDIDPSQIGVRGVYRHEVSRGNIDTLRFALPAALLVRNVQVRSDAALAIPIRLKDWRVDNGVGGRELVLELHQPASGLITVQLDLVYEGALASPGAGLVGFGCLAPLPQTHVLSVVPLADLEPALLGEKQVRLFLPTPTGVTRREGMIAARADRLTLLQVTLGRGVTPVEMPEAFEKQWPRDFGSVAGADKVFRYHSPPGPVLHVKIGAPKPDTTVRQDVHLLLAPGDSEVRVRCEASVAKGYVGHLEYRVPPELAVADIQGNDLSRWEQSGNRIHLWFRRGGASRTVFTLTGWWKNRLDSAPAALPRLGPVEATLAHAAFHLSAHAPFEMHLDQLKDLKPVTPTAAAGGVSLLASGPGYSGRVRLTPGQPVFDALLRSSVRAESGRFLLVTQAQCKVSQGSLAQLTLRLPGHHLDGIPQVEGQGISVLQRHRTPDGQWRLVLAVSGGNPMPTVSAPLRLEPGQSFDCPLLEVIGAAKAEHRFVVAKSPVTLAPASPMTPEADGTVLLQTGRPLHLLVEASSEQTPQVLFATGRSTPVGAHGWQHDFTYYVVARSSRRLELAGPHLLSVDLNGGPTPLGEEGNRRVLTLEDAVSVARVRVRWLSEHRRSRTGGSVFAMPTIGGQTTVPTLWQLEERNQGTISVGGEFGPNAEASHELRLAEQYLALAGKTAKDGRPAQDAEFRAEAREALARAGNALRRAGASAELRTRSRVDTLSRELADAGKPVPGSVVGSTPDALLPVHGIPRYVYVPELSDEIELTPVRSHGVRDQVRVFGTIGLAVLLVLSYLSGKVGWWQRRWRAYWPEVMTLLGLAAWLALPWAVPGLLLLALGIGSRLLRLAERWVTGAATPEVLSSVTG